MKQLLLTACVFLSCTAMASRGDITSVKAHDETALVYYGNYTQSADFQNLADNSENIEMLMRIGCIGDTNCSVWDYTVQAFVGDSTGVIDSTVASIDTTTGDTTWNVFEIVNWFELGRMITPYGTYMENRINGFDTEWEHLYKYDVTHLAKYIKGDVPIRILYSGYQTGFSATVDFEFTEGNQPRNVLGVQKIFRGGNYQNFTQFDEFMPASEFELPAGTEEVEVRVTVTGHGQAGEFTPITYTMKSGATEIATADIWDTRCDVASIQPQGGTWIFWRANWCPGEAVDVDVFDYSDHITTRNGKLVVPVDIDFMDYEPTDAASYIFEAQLVAFGAPQKGVDVSLEEITAPSQREQHSLINPICSNPRVLLRNTGSVDLTYAEIKYHVDEEGLLPYYFEWTGNLAPNEATEVELPAFNWALIDKDNPKFYASVAWPNQLPDVFQHNNAKVNDVTLPPVYERNDLQVRFRSNNRPEENRFEIIDNDGNIIHQENQFQGSRTLNFDYQLDDGCYTFKFYDNGGQWGGAGDGLNFFVNTQNNLESTGWVELRDPTRNDQILRFPGDFGGLIHHEFVIGGEIYDVGTGSPGLRPNHPSKSEETHFGKTWIKVNQLDGSIVFVDENGFVHDQPTSIVSPKFDFGLEMYPNPASDKVSVMWSAQQNRPNQVKLINLMGEQVHQANIENDLKFTLNLDQFASGIYVLELSGAAGAQSKRLVIQ